MEEHRSDTRTEDLTPRIRCRLVEEDGEVRVDVREYLGEMPSVGLSLAPRRLPALIAALKNVEDTARRQGLLHGEAPANSGGNEGFSEFQPCGVVPRRSNWR